MAAKKDARIAPLRAVLTDPSAHGVVLSDDEKRAVGCYTISSDYRMGLLLKERPATADAILMRAGKHPNQTGIRSARQSTRVYASAATA